MTNLDSGECYKLVKTLQRNIVGFNKFEMNEKKRVNFYMGKIKLKRVL